MMKMKLVLYYFYIILIFIININCAYQGCYEYSCEECETPEYGTCTKCRDTFALIDGTCPCSFSSCALCTTGLAGLNSCMQCKNGYYRYENFCYCEVSNCEICAEDGCTKCISGYYYNETKRECMQQSEEEKIVCFDPNCGGCFSEEQGACEYCKEGYDLKKGECIKLNRPENGRCTDSRYYVSGNYCYEKCSGLNCNGIIDWRYFFMGVFFCPSNNCLVCISNELKILSECDNSGTCSALEGCLNCLTSDECLICQQGYYILGGICKKCSEGCSICTSQYKCDYCMSGYELTPDMQCNLTYNFDYNTSLFLENKINLILANFQKEIIPIEEKGNDKFYGNSGGNKENKEGTDNIERLEQTENIGRLEQTENIGRLEQTENIERLEQTVKVERLEQTEIAKKTERIQNIENTQDEEITESQKNTEIIENTEKIAATIPLIPNDIFDDIIANITGFNLGNITVNLDYLNVFSTCSGGCSRCYDNIGKCIGCDDKYNLIENKCFLKCSDENCINCKQNKQNIDECLECIKGYALKDNKCVLNCTDVNCINCELNYDTCSECKSNYTLKEGKCLLNCADANCLSCELNSNNCVKCKDNYILKGNKCVQNCNEENCIRCSLNKEECLECDSNYILKDNKCILNCKDKNCLNCELKEGKEICNQCPEFYEVRNEKCELICLIDDCLECSTIGNNKLAISLTCSKCKDNYYFDGIKCRKYCQDDNCEECPDDTAICTACKSGSKLYNGECAKNADYCKDKFPFCNYCIKGEGCIECIEGYELNKNYCKQKKNIIMYAIIIIVIVLIVLGIIIFCINSYKKSEKRNRAYDQNSEVNSNDPQIYNIRNINNLDLSGSFRQVLSRDEIAEEYEIQRAKRNKVQMVCMFCKKKQGIYQCDCGCVVCKEHSKLKDIEKNGENYKGCHNCEKKVNKVTTIKITCNICMQRNI